MKVTSYFNRVLLKNLATNLEDPRRSARTWSFRKLIDSVMSSMLSGCKNLRELEYLSAVSGTRIPDTTAGDFLSQMSEESLERELVRGVKEASRNHELDERELPIRLTVIDGKCLSTATYEVDNNWLRRSQKGCTKYVAMALRAYFASSKQKLHLAQTRVPKGTNERGAFEAMLNKLLNFYGKTSLLEVISVDAGITSVKNSQRIVDANLHYIMALKNVMMSKMTQSAHRVLGAQKHPQRTESEYYNGKHITRKLYRAKAPAVLGWKHAREIWRIEKTTKTSKSDVVENHYYVTSLPKHRLSDRQVLKTIRMHWSIENNANWVLDTAWKEDKNPWCNQALGVISLLRLIAYNAVARFKTRKLRTDAITPIPWKHVLALIQAVLFPISMSWDSQFA